MRFEPANEQGVIVLFAQMAKEKGIEFVEVGTAFPDAVIRWQGVTYQAEFEYEGKNFISHGHDIRICDVIICWINNLPEGFPLPVIALADGLPDGLGPLAGEALKELWYWKVRALQAERSLRTVKRALEEAQPKKIAVKPALKDDEELIALITNGLTNFAICKQTGLPRSTYLVLDTMRLALPDTPCPHEVALKKALVINPDLSYGKLQEIAWGSRGGEKHDERKAIIDKLRNDVREDEGGA